MRRRQINQYRQANGIDQSVCVQAEDMAPKHAPLIEFVAAVSVPKGCCKHCGEHIGKGLYFHQKACGGRQ